jgi:antitoxin (DNA-binding transcriptional repressor) of toxin-antitoxin stability system
MQYTNNLRWIVRIGMKEWNIFRHLNLYPRLNDYGCIVHLHPARRRPLTGSLAGHFVTDVLERVPLRLRKLEYYGHIPITLGPCPDSFDVATMATGGRNEHGWHQGMKNRLTYLRQTKAGEEVVINERDRPIALIQKIELVKEPLSVEARLAKAASEGWLILPEAGSSNRIRKAEVRGKSVAQAVIEGRENRF